MLLFTKSIKRVKWKVTISQIILIGVLFLPVARLTSSGAMIDTLSLARRYAALGHKAESFFYVMAAIGSPVMTAICVWRARERNNFSAAAWLGALTSFDHACFYSAAKTALFSSIALTGVHILIVLLAIIGMLIGVHGYLLVGPVPPRGKKQ